jgi:beta-glucosidase-like glycosyl hydrolase
MHLLLNIGILQYNWWNESYYGVARTGTTTVFPQVIGMPTSFDTNMVKQIANIISCEAPAKYHKALRNKRYGMCDETNTSESYRRGNIHKYLKNNILTLYPNL